MDPSPDAREVERALTAYYEQEAGDRDGRPLAPRRLAARERFVSALGREGATRLLEVGIGPGRDAQAFVAAGVATIGIDLSVEHARLARVHGADAVVASVRTLPFADASFDALWTMSTLMHVPDTVIVDALAELHRVLRPNAIGAIGVWGGPDVEDHLPVDRYDPPRFFSRRSDERWRSLLAEVGDDDEYERWTEHDDSFWYQWAVVRRR